MGYFQFKITGMKDGKFVDYKKIKIHDSNTLLENLKKLEFQMFSIHKLYWKKHDANNVLIGLDVQVKETFDYDKFKTQVLPELLDKRVNNKLIELSNNKDYWRTILYCLNSGKKLNETRLKPSRNSQLASKDDIFRHSLRTGGKR